MCGYASPSTSIRVIAYCSSRLISRSRSISWTELSSACCRASVSVAIGTPGVTLFTSINPVNLGGSFSLSWNHADATECKAGGGGANGSPWTGTVATSGSAVQTASVLGQHSYVLECLINGVWRRGEVVITVREPPTPPPATGGSGGGSSSGGGGGASGVWEILLMLALVAAVSGRRRAGKIIP